MVHETYKLINTIKKMYPVVTFLKDRYFPDGMVYYAGKALVETKRKGRKAAPFVVPVVGGIVMESEGYRAYELDAPYIAPKMPITAKELENKAFGESPESGRTPAQRENEIQAEHMDDLRHSVDRRLEAMCGDILLTGETIMKHFATAEDAAKGINYTLECLRFYDGEFNNRYQFETSFEKMSASEKIMEFYKMADALRKKGIRATDLVMTADVSMLLLSDIEFLEFYNKAKVEIGDINPTELPDGVVCNGRININGVVMTMFTYDEEYEDLDGEVKAVFPKGTIAFLHPGLGETVYAQVTFVKGSSFESYAERIVPRLVADEKNNMIEVQVFSRPVPYPYDWESWLVANIYEEPLKSSSGDSLIESFNLEPDGEDFVDLKTAAEINAMKKTADVIAYADSIGLSGLGEGKKLDELKTAVLNYQEENFEEQEE